MGTTFDGVDIVNIGVDVLRIVGVVHHSYFDRRALLLRFQIDDIVEEMGTMTVHITDELFQTILGMKHLLLGLAFFIRTEVGKRDGDAGIQECQFAHALGNGVVVISGNSEHSGIGPELLAGTCLISVAYDLYVVERLSFLVFLLIDVTIAVHLRKHVRRKGIYTTDANAVD